MLVLGRNVSLVVSRELVSTISSKFSVRIPMSISKSKLDRRGGVVSSTNISTNKAIDGGTAPALLSAVSVIASASMDR